MGEYRCNSTHS